MLEVGTLTTASAPPPPPLGVAQRRQRVCGLAGLRDEDRQAALVDRRLAVAIFARDIDLDRQLGEALDPVFADEAGDMRRAAGDDRDAVQRAGVGRLQSVASAFSAPMST